MKPVAATVALKSNKSYNTHFSKHRYRVIATSLLKQTFGNPVIFSRP